MISPIPSGFEHISDIRGYDHILFIVALCAGYEPRHWKKLLILVTAFTVGHSITLALATLRIISVRDTLVELLIPLTILVTGVMNIVNGSRRTESGMEGTRARILKYFLALGFALIHGMSFSNFLRALLGAEEGIALPLFAFNVGLEIGQICIVLAVLCLTFGMVRMVRMRRHDWIMVLSGATAGVALTLMVERIPTKAAGASPRIRTAFNRHLYMPLEQSMMAKPFPGRLLSASLILALSVPTSAGAQHWLHDDGSKTNKSIFRLMDEWPTPNSYRTGSGSPGPDYWQQQVDYVIETTLDTVAHVVSGSERITYHNNAPEALTFLWVQLDQNVRSIEHSRSYQMQAALPEEISPAFRRFVGFTPFDGGYDITRVQLVGHGGELINAGYRINNTIMKISLPEPLPSGEVLELEIDWSFPVPDRGRGAKEQLNDGWIYELAQWFPRMSVFDDVNGWQTDQFLGRGEFYLEFGNYDVKITVPWNHIVDATGELQNPQEVLTPTQLRRLDEAYRSEEPSFIIPAEEVMDPSTRPVHEGTVTWHFKAENVRDFAWVSSKLFVWDAAGFRYSPDHEIIRVHSLYPREAMPLWDKVSTRATVQTLKTYGRMAFEYPYPKAINVNGPQGGMEYPMVAFCGVRPQPDGSYSDAAERGLIGVTIHEVGHNWFPMIVDSDERKWTWMDEGLNSFLQFYGQWDYAKTYCGTQWTQNLECEFIGNMGPAPAIVPYMEDPDQVPLMTESDLIHKDFSNNGYTKPAAGLLMLREHILKGGPFDEAFRDYATKWMFKRPKPSDFFRSMEEGAGEHLAWFWRGWFYTTHANDQVLAGVSTQAAADLVGSERQESYYHRIQIGNKGGLVMPVVMEITYHDGSVERMELPVDVWRMNEKSFTKGFFSEKQIQKIVLDPDEAFADIDRSDNVWEAPPAGT